MGSVELYALASLVASKTFQLSYRKIWNHTDNIWKQQLYSQFTCLNGYHPFRTFARTFESYFFFLNMICINWATVKNGSWRLLPPICSNFVLYITWSNTCSFILDQHWYYRQFMCFCHGHASSYLHMINICIVHFDFYWHWSPALGLTADISVKFRYNYVIKC